MERDDFFSAKVRSALTELLTGGMSTADYVAEAGYQQKDAAKKTVG